MKINSITFQVKLQRRSLGMLVFMKDSILRNFKLSQLSVYAKSPVLSGFGKHSRFAENLGECNGIICRKSITK